MRGVKTVVFLATALVYTAERNAPQYLNLAVPDVSGHPTLAQWGRISGRASTGALAGRSSRPQLSQSFVKQASEIRSLAGFGEWLWRERDEKPESFVAGCES